jgi:hypothetical protein
MNKSINNELILSAEYKKWSKNISKKIRIAHTRAAIKVN